MNHTGPDRDETHHEQLTEFELLVFKDNDVNSKCADAGWTWDEAQVTRTHPDDQGIHYRIDPVTQEVILSAKLVEQVRAELKRARRGGGR